MDAFYSHYPFLDGAKSLVGSLEGAYTQDEIMDKAQERLKMAVVEGEVRLMGAQLARMLELDLLSYAASRMVVAASKNKALCARVASAEAKRALHYLQHEDEGRLLFIAHEIGLGLQKGENGNFSLAFFDYLRFKPKEEGFKLSAKPIAGGVVAISRADADRFVQEAARMKMDVLLPVQDVKFTPEILAIAKEMAGLLPKTLMQVGNIAQGDFPPCICRIIEDMRNGEHIGHQARWALGVYLVRSGMKMEDILAIYASSPQYNEGTTKYQLEYLRQKEYSMPSCATMDAYGIAQQDCPCLVGGERRGTPITNSRRRTSISYEKSKTEKTDGAAAEKE
ncbi:hypothetical protein J4441_02120 [Candidatus Micrarchaeota archaeon]|nr:hypothetical protein [Candidatus Micrarchaeota archaeon]